MINDFPSLIVFSSSGKLLRYSVSSLFFQAANVMSGTSAEEDNRKPEDDRSILHPPCYTEPTIVPPSPEELDFAMQDVTPELYREFCRSMCDGIRTYLGPMEYLGVGRPFHVKGRLVGVHQRALVNLTCERRAHLCRGDADRPVLNVTFVIATGSPHTFLSAEAYEALIGRCSVPEWMSDIVISVQGVRETFTAYKSPPQSRFAHANILGTRFFDRMILECDYGRGTIDLKIIPQPKDHSK